MRGGVACLVEEVPAIKGISLNSMYIREFVLWCIPLQVFLVIGEYLTSFSNNPDLRRRLSDHALSVAQEPSTYLGVVFDILWMRGERYWLALKEYLSQLSILLLPIAMFSLAAMWRTMVDCGQLVLG